MLFVVLLSATSLDIPARGQTKPNQVVKKSFSNIHDGEAIFVKKCFQATRFSRAIGREWVRVLTGK
jgi:hypothetical protein